MEGNKRVYPAERSMEGWLNVLLLVFAAAVFVSGLWSQKENSLFSIQPSVVSTPVPLDETFDETLSERMVTLPSSVWYALQLGTFEAEKDAQTVAESYRRRGAAGFLWNDGRWRVMAAVYPLREDAQSVRMQLESKHDVETSLYQVQLPQLELRVSGMTGQLDILDAAFMHANDLAVQLHGISTAMDRQEMTAAGAADQLAAMCEQMDLVVLRMKQRFETPRNETVSMLIAMFEEGSAFCRSFHSQLDGVTAGMQLKHQTLSTLYYLQQIYHTLSHT